MFICKDCGKTFDRPEKIGVDYEAGGELILVCPHCHGFNYNEAVFCTVCEEAFPEEDCQVNEGVCHECMDLYYNSYLPVATLLNDDETRHEFMRWQGIPTVMDNAFCTALEAIRYKSWDEKERKRFLLSVRDYFTDDKYWFAKNVLAPAIQRYNIGEFERLYEPRSFLRFIGANWDPYSSFYLLFTAHYYNIPEATENMAEALGAFLVSGIEAERRDGGKEKHEQLRKAATEFARDYPYAAIAYCIYQGRTWLCE